MAKSLTKSSASLVAAGGNLAEAAALTATANAIIQDADSVGTALKTTSLRLRGTSVKVLEAEGLDSDGAVESTSKLRSQVLATSGVDILTDTGAYKSTYQILLEIAEVWDQITDDKARAGLLELLAGKRNSSVIAALLQNPKDLKAAYEDAMNAEGSALKENERYLDSIQGKIDQFNNAMQSMWSNTLDSDVVKDFVEFGTTLIKIVDDVGLLKIALMGVGMYLTRGIDFTSFSKPAMESLEQMQSKLAELKADMDDAIVKDAKKKTKKSHQKAEDATSRYNSYEAKVKEAKAEELLNKKAQERLDLQNKLNTATEKYEKGLEVLGGQDQDGSMAIEAFEEMTQLEEQIKKNGMSTDDASKRMKVFGDTTAQAGKKGMVGFQKIGTGIKAAGKALKQFLAQMAVMYAITTVLEMVADIFTGVKDWLDGQIETAEEAQDEFEKLNSELSDVKSELSSLNSELEDTQDRIDELLAQGTLSFTEQEELERLRAENDELERKIALNKSLEESLQKGVNAASAHATDMYLNTSFGSETSKTERQEEAAETGGKVGKYTVAAAGAAIGTAIAPGIGTLIGFAIGAFVGEPIGDAIGSAVEGAAYDAEQTVEDAMDNMVAQRDKLKKNQDEALASGDSEAYKNATEALQMYDKQMSQHITQIQANYNAMDWKTATTEERKQMIEYADWLDKYSIEMGAIDAKSNAIDRIFGEEATGGIAKARAEIDKLKKNLTEAKKSGNGVDDALANLKSFKLDLSSDEVERLRKMGIYLYEVEDYFKDVVDAETEFVNNNLEDVAKDINQISDGLDSLKTAFDEVIEDGVLTAKTILSIKEALNIDSSSTKELTSAWSEYLKVMMSGASTTEEMVTATERLTQAWVEESLANNALTPESREEYIAQLRSLGVENAEEYVKDLLQKNMVEEIELKTSTFNKNDVFEKWKEAEGLTAEADKTRAHQLWSQLSEDEIESLAKQYGVAYNQFAELSDEAKQDIIEKYDLEDGKLDEVLEKLKEKAKLEQDIAKKQKEQKDYNDWRDGDKGFLALKQDIEDIEKELGDFNPNEWLYGATESEGIVTNSWYYTNDGMRLTEKQFNDLKAKYDKYAALKAQYDELWEEGENKGYIVDGKVVDPNFQTEIDNLTGKINDIATEIDKELTVDVELQLKLQNKSELVDDIQNVFDTLVNAQKEYDETGYISVDTLQTLLQLEPKYLDLLVDESGNLNLTKDALYEVARARITDMGIQSQKNILEKANQLASKGSADALREQIAVMESANEVGADFVKIEMTKIKTILAEKVAAGKLTQAEADAFVDGTMNQIEAVQVATKSALANLNNSLSSSDNTATAEVEDAFQKAMDYWKNRIGANQSIYEQIQNDIDLLEKKGQIAGESYYLAQMNVENERLQHLKDQRAEALSYLDDFDPGSEKWWEIANELNNIENEIDDVTLSIQDLSDAMDQVHWTVFDEAHERFDNLTNQLSNVRDILSADEDSFFNDDGEWTEKGVAVLGTYIQEIEIYKNSLSDVEDELRELDINDFDSEQEYYDKLTELTDKQHEYTKVISDSEQAVVDMYESQVDAIEEYTHTLVESYHDYIDNVKEALDAERDLYDFKKKVKNESKNIAELERRIASLSGSTNASDIAERRRLEAELYDSKEALNETYYDHSKQSQQQALDSEATAYEESMTRYVDSLRTKLDEAIVNMDTFMTNVSNSAMLNAGTIKTEYEKTGLALDKALTDPWANAMAKVAEFSGEKGLGIMNAWTTEKGAFGTFASSATSLIKSPFSSGSSAMTSFSSTVSKGMNNVYSSIQTNVQDSITELDKLKNKYAEINDESSRAPSSGDSGGGGYNAPASDPNVKALQEILKNVYYKNVTVDGIWGAQTSEALKAVQKMLGVPQTGKFDDKTWRGIKLNIRDRQTQSRKNGYSSDAEWYNKYLNKIPAAFHAKGTTGTDRDEWAITDESWIGEEITLAAGKSGRLRGMMKGSAVLPSDISENLVEWGKLSPDEMRSGNIANNYVNAPTNDVDVANSLTIDVHSGNTQDVHDSIKDTYELIEDAIRNIDSISQHYKPSVDEALTTPWTDATEKANEFNAAANTNYDNIVSHIDENKESLEITLNTPYSNVTDDINDFSQHAKKASVDDVITHANEQSPALTTALSTGFNNAKTATDAFKTSGTSAVNTVKDAFTNAKTGLIKALNDTTAAAQKTKQAIDSVPSYSGGGGGASIQAGQHYISSLGKNVTLSSNVAKWSSIATQALQKTGQYSEDNLLLLLHQMQTESSGNQNAINNWDSNAKNGTPSKGLMQVIDPTFQSYAMNGYDKDIYDPLSNIIAAIRYTTSRYGSLSKGWRGSGYAKGTTGTSKDEWALTDEPQFGDELVLVPGKDGNLSFMRKGTGVVPADLTANLMEWGQFTPDSMNLGGGVNVNMINNAVNKPEFNFSFDALVKAEHIDENTLPEVKKFVQQEINSLVKQMNYAIKGKGAR